MTDLTIETGEKYVTRDGILVYIKDEIAVRGLDGKEFKPLYLGSNNVIYNPTGRKFDEDTVTNPNAVLYFEDLVFTVIDEDEVLFK